MSKQTIIRDTVSLASISVIFGIFQATTAGLHGVVVTLIAAVFLAAVMLGIRWLFTRSHFSGCKVDDSFTGESFEYKGKKYDKKKFLDNVLAGIRGTDEKKLQKIHDGSFVGEKKYPGYGAALHEAYKIALKEVQAK